MGESFTLDYLKRKTKDSLLEIISEQTDLIKNLDETVIQQSNLIKDIQKFQINAEQEVKETIKTNTQFAKAHNSMVISQQRIDLAIDILTPLVTENTGTIEVIDDSEIKMLANNILRNELTKIAKQQQVELKVQPKINQFMKNKVYNYSSLEQANKMYNKLYAICELGRVLGYNFKYEVVQDDTKVVVNIKQQLNLNQINDRKY